VSVLPHNTSSLTFSASDLGQGQGASKGTGQGRYIGQGKSIGQGICLGITLSNTSSLLNHLIMNKSQFSPYYQSILRNFVLSSPIKNINNLVVGQIYRLAYLLKPHRSSSLPFGQDYLT
jgi:hypothetical protein